MLVFKNYRSQFTLQRSNAKPSTFSPGIVWKTKFFSQSIRILEDPQRLVKNPISLYIQTHFSLQQQIELVPSWSEYKALRLWKTVRMEKFLLWSSRRISHNPGIPKRLLNEQCPHSTSCFFKTILLIFPSRSRSETLHSWWGNWLKNVFFWLLLWSINILKTSKSAESIDLSRYWNFQPSLKSCLISSIKVPLKILHL